MTRASLLLSGAALLASASMAGAAGDKPAPPPAAPAPAVVQPGAPPRAAPLQFMTEFFGGKRPGEAQSDPVSILPPGAAKPAAPAKAAPVVKPTAGVAPSPPPTLVLRVARVPMPRLRPAYQAPTAVAEAAAVPAIPAAGLDQATTGSIAEAPPHVEATAPPPVAPVEPAKPAPAQVASTPPPAAPEADDLLGDPSGYFAPASTEAQPRMVAPSGVGNPLPRSVGAAARGDAPVQAGLAGQPYELVRTLQSLQDQLARGRMEAVAAQQTLRATIEKSFRSAGPELWQDRRNDMAAVTYVLSGGAPDILRKFATMEPKPPIDLRLVAGVLAYAEGREKEAGELLGPIDPIALPASMGAQLAIAQSALVVRADPQKAMRLLAVARLVAPGTLAEEAAIRRQIFIADQLKDDKTVQSLARQYLDRFRHSVYAGNFRSRFAAALSHMDYINDEAQFPRLDDMLASVEPEARVQLYLTVALASAIKGRTVATRLASERALSLVAPGSVEQVRAQLYHAAALVAVAKTFDTAATEHGRVDRAALSPSDQALFDVVGATITGVRSATDRRPAGKAVAQATPAEQETPLMKKAAESLKAADKLLGPAP